MNTWSFNWVAPIAGTGNITFYGAFIEASSPIGNNQGDLFNATTLSFNESTTNAVNNLAEKEEFLFNPFNKTIESSKIISVYDLTGKIVLITKNNLTDISNLNKGIYILKSSKKSQKIILN